MGGLVNALALLIISAGVAYFLLTVGQGIKQLKRDGASLTFMTEVGFGRPFEPLDPTRAVRPGSWHLYFLVPCLNEEKVIGQTVAALRAPAGWSSTVVVVDDASDDRTADVAVLAGHRQVHVLRRTLPDARSGKGAALNAGYAHVDADVRRRGLDPERVLVVVMDADGRLSDGALHEVLPLFDDPTVGGVQLGVRIRNRDSNLLARFQDHQFWALAALAQYGRVATGTVSLGGNGQFSRLTALRELGEEPWKPAALTEDLDLAISLAVRGWRLTTATTAAVDQQGLEEVRPLLKQRTRWFQGQMMAGRRIPEVLRSNRLSHAGAIEMTIYLLLPWVFDLPWSILYHLVVFDLVFNWDHRSVLTGDGWLLVGQAALFYVLGYWPALVAAWLSHRRNPGYGRRLNLVLGHSFVVTNYLSFVGTWRALYRMVRGQGGWVKTARATEVSPAGAPTTVVAGSIAHLAPRRRAVPAVVGYVGLLKLAGSGPHDGTLPAPFWPARALATTHVQLRRRDTCLPGLAGARAPPPRRGRRDGARPTTPV
ncbi:glycosyltransferase [Nocardioides albidus]|nr:glycosyltransferase [Nocardioides albidus]